MYSLLIKQQVQVNSDRTTSVHWSLMRQGWFIYYAAEILAWTDAKEVDPGLSKELTQNIQYCLSSECKHCHSPFLTLTLLAEFMV